MIYKNVIIFYIKYYFINLIILIKLFDDLKKLVLLVKKVKTFVNNLKHVLNYFEII